MGLTVAGKNKALDGLVPDAISIHTGAPGDDGAANELSGGSYARQAVVFAAASAGSRSMTGEEIFEIPAGSNITHYAIWEAGVCIDTGNLQTTENYTGAGQYKLTGATLNAT